MSYGKTKLVLILSGLLSPIKNNEINYNSSFIMFMNKNKANSSFMSCFYVVLVITKS